MVTKLTEVEEAQRPEQSSLLHANVVGNPNAPVLVLLHGLFGMGSNLGALARALQGEYQVHLLDLPNHGRSPWIASMTLDALAKAVAAYVTDVVNAPVHVLGHSLGGKVAMQLALSYPQLVTSLSAADIAPVEYAGSHAQVFAAIAAVADQGPPSRREASGIMREYLSEEGVVQFLALSLRRDPAGRYVWRFNASVLERDYPQLLRAPVGEVFAGPALFVSGVLSRYVTPAGVAAAKRLFSQASFIALAETGHWLHVEKPTEFNAAVAEFLAHVDAGSEKSGDERNRMPL